MKGMGSLTYPHIQLNVDSAIWEVQNDPEGSGARMMEEEHKSYFAEIQLLSIISQFGWIYIYLSKYNCQQKILW